MKLKNGARKAKFRQFPRGFSNQGEFRKQIQVVRMEFDKIQNFAMKSFEFATFFSAYSANFCKNCVKMTHLFLENFSNVSKYAKEFYGLIQFWKTFENR